MKRRTVENERRQQLVVEVRQIVAPNARQRLERAFELIFEADLDGAQGGGRSGSHDSGSAKDVFEDV